MLKLARKTSCWIINLQHFAERETPMGLVSMDPTSVRAIQSAKYSTYFAIQLLRSCNTAGFFLILHRRLEVVTPTKVCSLSAEACLSVSCLVCESTKLKRGMNVARGICNKLAIACRWRGLCLGDSAKKFGIFERKWTSGRSVFHADDWCSCTPK